MIQFNLLPEVKLAYMRAKRRKHLVIVASSAVMAVSLTVLILMFAFVNVAQKQHLNDLSKDITTQAKALQDTPNLDSILTVQNQLLVLDALHDKKPVASRLFGYLSQITPSNIGITKLDVDFLQSTIKVTGSAKTLNDINQFADTLKFTDFTVGTSSDKTRAFSNVVLSSFGRTDAAANFAIDLSFEPTIFDNAKEVKMVVPDTVTTRSETEKPLFQKAEGEQ